MGNEPPKQSAPRVSLDDAIIEMKIQSKSIMRAAKKAEKQEEKYKKQAKDALKKNNQDFAKLYLTSASQKHSEFINYQRTAIKMQMMCSQVKSQQNNQKMVNSFGSMTNMVSQQMAQFDTAKMSQNMQMFNQKMDQILINNKMMTEIMSGNEIMDTNADQMFEALKQEIALQDNAKIIEGAQQQTNQQYNQKMAEGHDPFLDQLKGL